MYDRGVKYVSRSATKEIRNFRVILQILNLCLKLFLCLETSSSNFFTLVHESKKIKAKTSKDPQKTYCIDSLGHKKISTLSYQIVSKRQRVTDLWLSEFLDLCIWPWVKIVQTFPKTNFVKLSSFRHISGPSQAFWPIKKSISHSVT